MEFPHTALCGGKGRCTTCRVIVEDGADQLPEPSDIEARSLAAVSAPEGARLACQIRPTEPITAFRMFRPDGARHRAHASQGQERQLAVLFLDMRGFTSRTTGQLPYDIVFLLNRFFRRDCSSDYVGWWRGRQIHGRWSFGRLRNCQTLKVRLGPG